MNKKSAGTLTGVAFIIIGAIVTVIAEINLSNQMDRADREGTGGNLFDPGILPLALAGLLVLAIGIIFVARSRRSSRGNPPR